MVRLSKIAMPATIRRAQRALSKPEYRTYGFLRLKLHGKARYKPAKVRVNGWNLEVPDAASFLSAYREIFVRRIYAFKCEDPSPRILDLGANLGLSVLFFKKLYPQAQIVGFEPDPRIFDYLKRNIHGNGFTDVHLVNKAAWDRETTLQFSSTGGDAGRVAFQNDSNLIKVAAANMTDYLQRNHFDFIKMDVEGAEETILPAIRDHLKLVKWLFVEYHSKAGKKQSLGALLDILSQAGFRIHIHSCIVSPSPFVKITLNCGFDMQLNIFAWRDQP